MIGSEHKFYQTIPLPDGSVTPGLFNTVEWYSFIKSYVNFKDAILLDIGCCQFSYGIQALNDGADHVIGLDSDSTRIEESDAIIKRWDYQNKTTLINGFAEELDTPENSIILFSMVIHWMKDAEFHIKRLLSKSKTAVFLYRVRGFDDDTGYLPTIHELDALVGIPHKVHSVISDTKEQNIRLTIYDLK